MLATVQLLRHLAVWFGGLLNDGLTVTEGFKISDIDPRGY